MSNVLPFKRPEVSKKQKSDSVTSGQETLEQIAERNRLNQDRLKAERLADTKKVLQNYRIKN